MALNVESITFDTTDPDKAAQWWAQAAGGQLTPYVPGEYVAVERQPGPKLLFQKVADPTPGKNKIHLDFSAADVDAEVKRLVDLGATENGRHSMGPVAWVVLTDPEGNAFCVTDEG
ncbi:putative enzyme related to lactoylglutathione lyase [Mycobacterium sp. OAS707]|uniref:VOC family protein n=1 Tax=unclassified Mycobacterium TaxID=2642494 RepID=UPI001789B173|nr:VOC family protein [Mycobacterium sp. OAS707]MBE1549902.1 putative enzyme related to lactoylglutathione lyase [Mycobacterium sp. OAS707]